MSLHAPGRGVPSGGMHPSGKQKPMCDERMASFTDSLLDTLERMGDTCALDVADRGAHTQTEAAGFIGLPRQHLNMIERRALRKAEDRNRDPRAPA